MTKERSKVVFSPKDVEEVVRVHFYSHFSILDFLYNKVNLHAFKKIKEKSGKLEISGKSEELMKDFVYN